MACFKRWLLAFMVASNIIGINGGSVEKIGQIYLDQDGSLCQDNMETVEDTEYETMIQCNVALKKMCDDENGNFVEDSADNEACHTVYEKKCKLVYRPQANKVRVKVCPQSIDVVDSPFGTKEKSELENSVVIDVRPQPRQQKIRKKCQKGRRTVCSIKHQTECRTEQVQQTMEEDHPRCRLERVDKCPENLTRDAECHRVPAMRCTIETRTVVKTKPESKCFRVPRQFCRKEACDEAEDNNENDPQCYYRYQIVNEIVPEEKCNLLPKKMCHALSSPGDNSTTISPSRKRFARDAGEDDPWAFLRRHYLSRHRNMQSRRQSRDFSDVVALAVSSTTTTSAPPAAKNSRKCKMVPEQRCEKKRINPKIVVKEMRRKICRKPRSESFADQYLVAKLRQHSGQDKGP